MNIQNALLPFIENEDYQIVEDKLIALPKVRLVDQLLHHPEIVEVLGEKMEDVGGVFKLNKQAILLKGVPAYDETIKVEETYYEAIPTLEALKMTCISDIALAISEFLSDKQDLVDHENDSINIVEGKLFAFNFKNIVQPNADTLLACYEKAIAKQVSAAEKAAALKYLEDTDYKIIKAMELNTSVAPEILKARAAARTKL